MRTTTWARAVFAVALATPLAAVGADPASAAPRPHLTATPLAATDRLSAPKGATSRLAESDEALVARTDSAAVNVVIKLDYDSIATYSGNVRGYPATSPAKTGRPLSNSAAEKHYTNYVSSKEDAVVAELAKRVQGVRIGQRLRTVYGGVAAVVPANRVKDILGIKGVVAVQSDTLHKTLTDASPAFLGATALYPQLGGTSNAGRGVIFGVLDTGAWPEHPEFADQGNLGAPPPRADGVARTCNFGDNPLTPASDVFVCNHKLIAGQPFLSTYNSDPDRRAGELYPDSARDSDGHGTHTGSTAAGNALTSAKVFGVERGPLNGLAPGAWVSVYKVCGIEGCFSSDSAAAVQQAIRDGVKVINFSISGGTNPFADPVELAFLDAYAAGVFVATSAGNDGPTASTVNHLSPWVTTVAASTQRREFDSTLTVTSSDGTSAAFTGASITAGAGPAPVVLASATPYNDILCNHPAPPGVFSGKIVVCQRGVNGRVQKGFNVVQGGALGMILYNPTLADVETDNHFLPAVHLADGTAFLAYYNAHPGITAAFTAGQKVQGQGDVMAAFSSRGPAGNFVKPDVAAPGVQILAGNTPTPQDVAAGPAGQYFQAIAGTSMSSPHTAGAAILLLALHPTWTPGQVKSALMTTAIEQVVKEDGHSPTNPFDRGSGRITLGPAGNPGLTIDETAARMAALGNDPVNAVNLNLPSIDAPVMPGTLTTTRTVKNVGTRNQNYQTSAVAPSGTSITVSPNTISLAAGASATISITISATTATGQQFGSVLLRPTGSTGLPMLHLPVAFVPTQGVVGLASTCAAGSIAVGTTTTCTVTATNTSFTDTTVNLTSTTNDPLAVTAVNGATRGNPHQVTKQASLAGKRSGVPSIGPGVSPGGYIPLDALGVSPIAIGDEQILNFSVPAFLYDGVTYTKVGVDSNGYLVVGGGTSEDNNCCDITDIPNPARPNNVLAPFWTDLDGGGAPGIFLADVTDGVNSWVVAEWRVNVFGTSSVRRFQVWLGHNGAQDISFTYDPATNAPPFGQPFRIGAENETGTGGGQLAVGTVPAGDLVVTSTDPSPGGSTSYTMTIRGDTTGTGVVTNSMVSPLVPGTTVVRNTILIR